MKRKGTSVIYRYVIHPGYYRKRGVEELVYMTAGEIIKKYGVPLRCCIISDDKREWLKNQPFRKIVTVHLLPRADGKYDLKRVQRQARRRRA